MAIAAGDTAKKYKVQASKESVGFFTKAALNLVDGGPEDPLPINYKLWQTEI
ncbi:MAG: hypothetical protein KME31_22045 [Tolypothrix carrinoi HA7290-LM1]|jgi:hypothetical protein|nr:hypothetical protein [Tolypothrix carrinoi HA7290-LM1]